jgi:hypothetical protein
VHFTLASAILKSRLHALLASEEFVDIYRPSATEFDVLQNALSGELAELGSKINETTGNET